MISEGAKPKKKTSSEKIQTFIRDPYQIDFDPGPLLKQAFDRKKAEKLIKKIKKQHLCQSVERPPTFSNVTTKDIDTVMSELRQKHSISHDYRNYIKDKVYLDKFPDKYRRDLWMYMSGAKFKKEMEPGYYHFLLREHQDYPNFYKEVIELDLGRTYHDRPLKEVSGAILKMRNILRCFTKRNPDIGYCQGMNYLVAKIISVIDDEEDAFWIFVCLIEDILPLDYFSNMAGMLIVLKVFTDILYQRDPIVAEKFSELSADPTIFSLQWFVCCYVCTFSDSLSTTIWDLLFLEGKEILYKSGIVFFNTIRDKFLKLEEFDEIFMIIDQNPDFTDKLTMLKDIDNIYISSYLLKILTKKYSEIVKKDLEATDCQKRNSKDIIPKEKTVCNKAWPTCFELMTNQKYRKVRDHSVLILSTEDLKDINKDYFSFQQPWSHKRFHYFIEEKEENTEYHFEEDSSPSSREDKKLLKGALIARQVHTCIESENSEIIVDEKKITQPEPNEIIIINKESKEENKENQKKVEGILFKNSYSDNKVEPVLYHKEPVDSKRVSVLSDEESEKRKSRFTLVNMMMMQINEDDDIRAESKNFEFAKMFLK